VRVLGIDPGLTRCGLGVVDGSPGRSPSLVAVGVTRTPPGRETAERLLQIEQAVEQWTSEYRPDAIAVERVFAQHNVATVMGTAQAAGVAMLVAARWGIPLALHTPSEVKAAITGSGRAGKAQVTTMVTRVLQLSAPPRPADAADALALAICHVWRGAGTSRVDAALERAAEQSRRQRAALAARVEQLRRSAAQPLAPDRQGGLARPTPRRSP
jgi:crossover junction endodeoxyribonuclease RuvC